MRSRDSRESRAEARATKGPGLLDGIKAVFKGIPSEEVLEKLLEDLPRLEKLVTNPVLEKISRLADLVEAGKLDSIEHMLPVLQNMPDNSTLVDIANLKTYLANLPPASLLQELVVELQKLPSKDEMRELIGKLEAMQGFLRALKGV